MAVYRINRMKEIIDHAMCSQLISTNAIIRSDMASRFFRVGKRLLSRSLLKETIRSVLCERIHRPEPDNIGYRWPGSQLPLRQCDITHSARKFSLPRH